MSSVSPIVGIGSTYFGQFTNALQGQEPDIAQAMSLVLASLALLGLGIFGPTIASGLVAGAPQLGAGSVMATGALAAGGLAATAGAGIGAARGLAGAGLGAVRAGTSMGSATASAYHTGQQEAGAGTIGGGLGGISNAARGGMAGTSAGQGAGPSGTAGDGDAAPGQSASTSQGQSRSKPGSEAAQDNSDATPNWARKLQSRQNARHRRQMITHALQSGDRGGHGANPDIKEKED